MTTDPLNPYCRCIYCSQTSKVNRRLVFMASEKKVGRSKEVWGICHKCLSKAMAQLCDKMEAS